jgi:hypothetical protein
MSAEDRKAYFWNNIENNGYDYREVNGNLYMTTESVAQVAYDAGFRGESLLAIVAIAGRESSYSPVVHGTAQAQSNISGDRGLWQINYVHDDKLVDAGIISSNTPEGRKELFDPLTNAKAAFFLSQNGSVFAPWNAAAGGYTANGDPFYGTNVFKAADAIDNAGLGDEIKSWSPSGGRNPSLFEASPTPTSYPQQTTYGVLETFVPDETDFMSILRTVRSVGLGNTEGLETFLQSRQNVDEDRPLNYSQSGSNNTIDLSNVLTPAGQETADGSPGYTSTSTEAVLEPNEPLAPVNPPIILEPKRLSEEEVERKQVIDESVERIAENLQPHFAECLLDAGKCDQLTPSEKATLSKVRLDPNSDLLNELEPMAKPGWQASFGSPYAPGRSSNPFAAIENELQRVDEIFGYVPKTSDNTTIRQIEGSPDATDIPDWMTNTAGPTEVPLGVQNPDTLMAPDPEQTVDPAISAYEQYVASQNKLYNGTGEQTIADDGPVDTGVPYDWETAAQELYPQYWAIVKNNPEIAQLLRDSLGPPAWSDAKFQAKLYETNWWRSTSASVRQWDTASQLDPATYQEKVENQKSVITQTALDKGIKLSDETLTELATNSLRMGWTNQMIVNSIGMSAVEGGTTGMSQLTQGYYGQQMRQYASQYGVSLADTTFDSYINKIAVGEENLNSFQDYVMSIGKSLYPTLTEQFDAGQTFATATAGYQQIAANILERDPNSISMSDPMFVTAVTYQPDQTTGEQRMMNMAEWGEYLRNDDQLGYEYTSEARSRAYATADKIANMFGRI